IKSYGFTDLKYIKMAGEDEKSLYFAVRTDWPLLVSILDKALASITEEEKLAITDKWIGINENPDYGRLIRMAGMAGAVIALALMVSFFWIRRLRKEIEIRKQIQDELNIAKNEAESANQVKSMFLARMSHEIRTPLNAIIGMAYLLRKTDINATQRNYLHKITEASNNMLAIINDILDFSKIEAGKVEIENVPFNLDNLLSEIINIISFKVEEQGIHFTLEKDPDMPEIFKGDPTRIGQVLLNIVNNAVKFTPQGMVSLSVHLAKKEMTTCRLQFVVTDTGIGMSEEQLSQIFKPFDQGESSINRRFGGTGLGLSIAKNLLDLMGGEIAVESTPEQGSRFTIQLELEAEPSCTREENRKKNSVFFKNLHALVMEKSAMGTELLKKYLHSFAIAADFAASDAEAMRLIEQSGNGSKPPYNLFIIDFETPKEGGIGFFNFWKQAWSASEEMPKCIMMVPLTRADLHEAAEAAKIDFTINKPVLPSVLYNAIVEIFNPAMLEAQGKSLLTSDLAKPVTDYPYHVLIVEDNKTNQFIAKTILEQSGLRTSIAENGQEGYDCFLALQDELDAILMDLHMPVLDGFEATALIRTKNKKIPIIAMTADAITGIEEQCRRIGIDHYVSKPFDPDQFVATIIEVIQSQPRMVAAMEKSKKQTAAARDEEAALDVAAGLNLLGGKEDLYDMVLQQYLLENESVPQLLQAAIAKLDYKNAVQIIHKIKGSSGNIGAKTLHKTARELQQALSEENTAEIDRLHHRFLQELQQLLQQIQQRLQK
ncbi:MAG TPA: ATP-binding protein, partial [Syntrophomonas sp.]|nr:ATP-binding protein [Syntrophomonas sp.]